MNIHKKNINVCIAVTGLLFATITSGCSAKAKQDAYLRRANEHFASGAYEKAKIEYLNLLRINPGNVEAIRQLGIIWSEQGVPFRALPYLAQMRALEPDNLEIGVRLVEDLTSLGGVPDARKVALEILEKSPKQAGLIKLLAESARTPAEIAQVEELIGKDPERETADFHVASATLALRKKDLSGADSAIRKALANDPKSSAAHQVMATLYGIQKRNTEAGAELRRAAELAPMRSTVRVKYAEFKLQNGALKEGKGFLEEMTKAAPDYVPVWRALAKIAFIEKDYDEAQALAQKVFAVDPEDFDTRRLQCQLWIEKGEVTKGIAGLERLEKDFPMFPLAKFQLANAYLRDNNTAAARAALERTLAALPDHLEAILLLGEQNLKAGDAATVVTSMEALVAKQPDLSRAQLLLANAYRAVGRPDDAAAILLKQINGAPQNGQLYLALAITLKEQNKPAEARQVLEKALELASDKLPALSELVELDLTEQAFDTAMHRVREQIEKTPNSAGAHYLEGRIYYFQKDWDRAEDALQKTLELDASTPGAYDLLISIYLATDRLQEALGQVEALLSKQPDHAIALTVRARIYHALDDAPKACDAYLRVLAVSPDSVLALNNLAYLYSERLNDLAKGYDMARKAHSLQPADPSTAANVADTLGWILYKRGEYQRAIGFLQESVAKLTPSAEIQYHLGMASYMMGQTDAARTALSQAAAAPEIFPGKEQISLRLALLGGSGEAKELTLENLEALVKKQPDDPLAQMRLGEAYEQQKAFPKAAAAYEEALALNPSLLSATIKLAQLNAGPLQNKTKAFELAKTARQLAPNDPQVAGTLGGIAYQTGNSRWAYNLLQESVRQKGDATEVFRDLAWAAYSLGKVREARQALQRLLEAVPESAETEGAKTFLAMTDLDQNPGNLAGAEPAIQEVLKADPNYIPALIAKAALKMQRGDTKTAITIYEDTLRKWPDFAVAQKHLASCYAETSASLDKAGELAIKARETLPDDLDLARTLAVISYKRKNYSYAIQLLREREKKEPLDADSLFYLGMSQSKANQKEEGRVALQKAVAAGLKEPLAAEAKQNLKESEVK